MEHTLVGFSYDLNLTRLLVYNLTVVTESGSPKHFVSLFHNYISSVDK